FKATAALTRPFAVDLPFELEGLDLARLHSVEPASPFLAGRAAAQGRAELRAGGPPRVEAAVSFAGAEPAPRSRLPDARLRARRAPLDGSLKVALDGPRLELSEVRFANRWASGNAAGTLTFDGSGSRIDLSFDGGDLAAVARLEGVKLPWRGG